jgi:repressor LexA
MFLTKRQSEVFEHVKGYISRRGYAPSIEEIRDHLKLSAVSTVHKHLKFLEEKGLLRRTRHQSRGLELTDADQENGSDYALPLLGTIAAGEPIEALEVKEHLSIPGEFFSSGNTYVLKVRGNSMIGEQIRDGDFVIIEKKETAENGEMVAALVNQSEVTLKKFFRQPDGNIRLEPANPEMEPIIVPEENVRVQGRVIGILRKY